MFHVFIISKGADEFHELFLDLSETELRQKFVNPYLDGEDIYDKGSITRISDIARVAVLRSELSAKETLDKLAADHQAELARIKHEEGLNVLGSYRGRKITELFECCEDVTEQKIARAPGAGTPRTKFVRFLHNPWVVRVGGGLLLVLLGVVIGRYSGNG